MIATLSKIALLFGALSSVSASCSSGNTTCLDITLWDMFGDGWGGAKLYVEFPDGSVESDAPTCDYNPVYHTICADSSGQYYLTAQSENITIPYEYWEVFWTATVDYCDDSLTDLFYTGGFNTTMVWDYNYDTDSWSLVFWDNLWPNEDTCDACGDAKACKPKPKKKKPKKKPSPKKDEDTSSTEVTNTTTSTEFDGPKYGPPAVNVRVTMFDEEGDGWFQSDYHGANWYIYDSTRTELFYSGTLCDGWSGQCKLCLGDGSYIYRATGEISNFTSWDFCGVVGTYQEELTFHVKKGKCIPDVLRNITEVCLDDAWASVTVVGTFALSGMTSELFDASDAKVLFNTISTEVVGLEVSKMELVSTVLDSQSSLDSNGRKLSLFTHDVTFRATFNAQSFETNGIIFSDVQEVVENMRDSLSSQIDNGEFLSVLVKEATSLDVSVMSTVQGAELLSLEVESITYSGSQDLVYSTLKYDDEDYSYSVFSSKLDIVSVAVFFSALAVGFIAFVGIMSKGMSGYKSVAQESQHGSYPVDEVMPSESEHVNASPKISNVVVGKVEATI